MTTNLVLAVTIGGLFATGVYLMLSKNLIRVILGFMLAGHGVNLMLLAVGIYGAPPIVGEGSAGEPLSDPVPQALILTSIVITLAVSTFLFAMAYRNYVLTRDPELEDEPEDEFADAEQGAGEE